MSEPLNPKIYHIVHVDRLHSIATDGFLWSDKVINTKNTTGTTIGMGDLKETRLVSPVKCHPETMVGEYVPFYYCPRSIMLYIIHMANNPKLAYRGGQRPIIHMEFDLSRVLQWATLSERKWAIALGNATARLTEFRGSKHGFGELDWDSILNDDFKSSEVKERKQAEFLVYHSVPWNLIERIGVHNLLIKERVMKTLRQFEHVPTIEIRPDWYY
jgi:hypothetical protein